MNQSIELLANVIFYIVILMVYVNIEYIIIQHSYKSWIYDDKYVLCNQNLIIKIAYNLKSRASDAEG